MSAFVMIVLFSAWSGDGGVHTREVGFQSMEACVAARSVLLTEFQAAQKETWGRLGNHRLTVVCAKR